MSNVVVIVFVVVVVLFVVNTVQRRRRGLVAERGTSVGADVGAMRDQAQVRITAVSLLSEKAARLQLEQLAEAADDLPPLDLDFAVGLRSGDLDTLEAWRDAGTALAIARPPDSHIVVLRSTADLQRKTFRRID